MRTYEPGQALYGSVMFKNGAAPQYRRYYLVVEVDSDFVGIVDVSSTAGKEQKLLYNSNYELEQHYPPFPKPSFVKTDSFRRIPISKAEKLALQAGGKRIREEDLNEILSMIKKYTI